MVYPHKWSPISCRSIAGQGKFASQRPMFYRCATQPTWEQHWQLLSFGKRSTSFFAWKPDWAVFITIGTHPDPAVCPIADRFIDRSTCPIADRFIDRSTCPIADRSIDRSTFPGLSFAETWTGLLDRSAVGHNPRRQNGSHDAQQMQKSCASIWIIWPCNFSSCFDTALALCFHLATSEMWCWSGGMAIY